VITKEKFQQLPTSNLTYLYLQHFKRGMQHLHVSSICSTAKGAVNVRIPSWTIQGWGR